MILGSKQEMKKSLMKSINNNPNHFILIESFEATQQDDGTWLEEWTTLLEVWASKKNLHGSEYYVAGQVNKQETVKFTIRYMPGIDEKPKESMRIYSEGAYYDIDFIDNINYENTWLEIKAVEQAFGGGQNG